MTWRRALIGLGLVLVCVAGWFLIEICLIWKAIPDQYAAWDTANLVVEYLDTHDGQWPSSWEDLQSVVPNLPHEEPHLRFVVDEADRKSYHVDRLKERISVDWTANPEVIAATVPKDGNLGVKVITRADGSDIRVLFADPNGIVWSYLKGHQTARSPDG